MLFSALLCIDITRWDIYSRERRNYSELQSTKQFRSFSR